MKKLIAKAAIAVGIAAMLAATGAVAKPNTNYPSNQFSISNYAGNLYYVPLYTPRSVDQFPKDMPMRGDSHYGLSYNVKVGPISVGSRDVIRLEDTNPKTTGDCTLVFTESSSGIYTVNASGAGSITCIAYGNYVIYIRYRDNQTASKS